MNDTQKVSDTLRLGVVTIPKISFPLIYRNFVQKPTHPEQGEIISTTWSQSPMVSSYFREDFDPGSILHDNPMIGLENLRKMTKKQRKTLENNRKQ